jgi:hypothetical protein
MLCDAVCQRQYALHGISFIIRAAAPVLSVLDARLRPLCVPSTDIDASGMLTFEFTSEAEVQRPTGDLRRVYEPMDGEVLYAVDEDVLYLDFGASLRARCEPTAGVTRVFAREPAHELWRLSHPILTLPLIEQLKRRGLYSLHAAGIARGGRALIIAGTSGAGKTTLALALARAGLDFLGDDLLFLQDASPTVVAFPDEVDVTQTTARFFPELEALADRPRQFGFPKWTLRAEDVFATALARHAEPAALLFPLIGADHRSCLEPMASSDALMELLPNVLLTEPASCQAHLHALARLAQSTPCYRLTTGRDFDALPELMGALL